MEIWPVDKQAILQAIRRDGPFPSRVAVREQVLTCERCDLYKKCRAPVPFIGPSSALLAILGEAPGHNEDVKGQPFIGPAGLLLTRELKKVEVDPEQAFIFNAVSCFPHKDGKARRPTDDEIKACAPNRYAQLALARPRVLLVLGGTALYSLRPDLKISKARGRPFCLLPNEPKGIIVLPAYHPSAALRNGNFLTALQEDLATLACVLKDPEQWVDHLPNSCSTCGEVADPWRCDAHGIVYCETHIGGHLKQEWEPS